MSKANDELIDDLMRPLRERYLKELARSQKKLRVLESKGKTKPFSDDEREKIRHMAHQSMGTGKIFGFPEITKTGSKLEDYIMATPKVADDVILTNLEKFLNACDAAQSGSRTDQT